MNLQLQQVVYVSVDLFALQGIVFSFNVIICLECQFKTHLMMSAAFFSSLKL